jgi:uncharacterized protein VirK/YbjX
MIHHIVGSTLVQGMVITLQGIALASVAARQLGAHEPRRRLETIANMLLFAAMHPRATLRWLRYLEHPTLKTLVQQQPHLLDKPRRLYLNSRWTPDERVQALMTHYRWMAEHLRPDIVEALYAGQPLKLCDIATRGDTHRASLWLDHARLQMREGELALQLRAATTEAMPGDGLAPVLATLSFSVVDGSGRPNFSIGCVQGPRQAGLPEFKALTKAMNGLRPKALLVLAAQTCAMRWDLDVRGIASTAHPLTDKRYRRRNPLRHAAAENIHAAYGTLWRESGGADADADGWVQLPATPTVKSRDEVESAKRSLYERRGVLLARLDADLAQALQNIAPGHAEVRNAAAAPLAANADWHAAHDATAA